MTDGRMMIQRRFPSFDFVFETKLDPNEAASKLERFLSRQERPTGFVLVDPRVDGSVSGATFELRRRSAGLGGSIRPYAEGYFVPTAEGSSVYVRVQIGWIWWLSILVAFAAALIVNGERASAHPVLQVSLLAIALLFMSMIPVWLEGAQMVRLVRHVFTSQVKHCLGPRLQ